MDSADVLKLYLARQETNCLEFSFVHVPSCSFTMGMGLEPINDFSDALADAPFEVELTHDYWMAQFQVTQSQWQVVFPKNPSKFAGPNRPIDSINWHQACFYAEQLDYLLRSQIPEGYTIQLPTEAQWEFACRAGTPFRYSIGDSEDDLAKIAWYYANSGGTTHDVGQKLPNPWMLYDMLGNVCEWCRDGAEDYPDTPQRDWVGDHMYNKIIRGGSFGGWRVDDQYCVGGRSYAEPTECLHFVGFRLAISRT